jgi:hypothetical protein
MFVSPLALEPPLFANRRRSVDAPLSANPIADLQTDEVEVICCNPTTGEERTATGHLAAVDGRVFLRPRRGRRCSWARALAGGESLSIATQVGTVPVTPVLLRDAVLQHRVTEALLARFGYDPAMPGLLDDAALAATVELVPAVAAASAALAA